MPLFGWTYASFAAPLLGKSLAHFLTFKMRQNGAASCVSVELRRKEQLGRRSWVISVVGHVYMKSFSSLQRCCIFRAQMNLVSPIMTEILVLSYSSVKLPIFWGGVSNSLSSLQDFIKLLSSVINKLLWPKRTNRSLYWPTLPKYTGCRMQVSWQNKNLTLTQLIVTQLEITVYP